MIEQIAAAIQRRDYSQASRLLQPLLKEQPQNPWVKLYAGQLHEVYQRPEQALKVYRHLLQSTINRQVIQQARQGIARLAAASAASPEAAQSVRANPAPTDASAARQASAGQASAGQGSTDPASTSQALTTPVEALLVLRPPAAADRDRAIAAFAEISSIDPYTARTHLPIRGLRFHRIGELAPLRSYQKQLHKAKIPALLLPLELLQACHVFRVQGLRQTPSPSVLCKNQDGQLGNLTFTWQEVACCVEGRVPIFEEVVDRDARKRLLRKQKTQDYAYLLDLHLPQRRSILRFCDQTYQFTGQSMGAPSPSRLSQQTRAITRRQQWQALKQTLLALSDRPVWTDFIPFAESALEDLTAVPDFHHHVDILRKEKTPWDKAFHVYSSLAFNQPKGSQP